MKEVVFIQKNKDRWKTYETPTFDPDELASRFISLIDDLGYAKTHYPMSNTVNYLNSQASNIYLSIYKNQKPANKGIGYYFTHTLPLIIYKNRKVLLFALAFFTFMYLIGLFIAFKDPNFIRAILGDNYVNMTKENVAKGKPFGVYGEMNPILMFFMIAWNNIRVALLTFCGGLLFIVGSLYFLFKNGIMVGTFHQMFIEHGLGVKWGLIVMIHGTLELFSIAIAGACGVMLGSALLFPGTYTRIEKLKQAAKDAVQIMLVVVILLFLAAIFESFVTRFEHMPIWINIPILLISVTILYLYFYRLPIQANRKQQSEFEELRASFLRYY